jgi:DNA-binding transcriptional ArsR family regulator
MATTTRRDVFQAIADPTRRRIIALIAINAMTLNAIADNFNISRPAISQHIKILQECGIVQIEKTGRERYCKIQPVALKEVADWAVQYRKLWEDKLDAFEDYLHTLQTKNK